MDTLIEAKNVSLRFSAPADRKGSFKKWVLDALRGQMRRKGFLAVDNVSFSIRRGESVGLVGRNGAGKSTLLKLVTDNAINLQFRIWRPVASAKGGMEGGMEGGMKRAGAKAPLEGGMKTADAILMLMKEDSLITHDSLAMKLGKARNTIIKQIAKLKARGLVRRVGPDKGGHWEVL